VKVNVLILSDKVKGGMSLAEVGQHCGKNESSIFSTAHLRMPRVYCIVLCKSLKIL
jgi:hypothetical protein